MALFKHISDNPDASLGPPAQTTRYDPLAAHRETSVGQSNSSRYSKSPPSQAILPPYTSHALASTITSSAPKQVAYVARETTPLGSGHSHLISDNEPPSSIVTPPARTIPSPAHTLAAMGSSVNGPLGGTDSCTRQPSTASTASQDPAKQIRKAHPMSLSNMLSGDVSAPVRKSSPAPTSNVSRPNHVALAPAPPRTSTTLSNGDRQKQIEANPLQRQESRAEVPVIRDPRHTALRHETPTHVRLASNASTRKTASANKINIAKETERIRRDMDRLVALEMSDDEDDIEQGSSSAFDEARRFYSELCQKRQIEIELMEESRRKRRRTVIAQTLSMQIATYAEEGKQRFRILNESAALEQAQRKEQQDEKERKKDMQRKRRREKTMQTQSQLREEAFARAQNAEDAAQRQKHIREARRAEKKLKSTRRILEDEGDMPESMLELSPLPPDLVDDPVPVPAPEPAQPVNGLSPEPPAAPAKKKSGAKGGGSRPKKPKHKKDAEKAAAEAGFAAAAEASTRRDDYVAIAPKEASPVPEVVDSEVRETRQLRTKGQKKDAPSPAPAPTPPTIPVNPTASDYSSKGYNQLYEQIWRDIARKEIPKVFRIREVSLNTKQSNMKKTVQLASKEARRWQQRSNKANKDVQVRAKRAMREMMAFWKRNEKAERDLRKNAEKQELENARKAEADRESNRQKRKLNFLIEQTELYSHFIGRKIKTDEVERSTDNTDGVEASTEVVQPGKSTDQSIALPEFGSEKPSVPPKVTNFEDLDFDAEDDATLRQAAMANAQNAVEEAQARARAFNGQAAEDVQSQFDADNGEMNFQNPTGMGDINISQPKMLTAQLKEYQLKGLNWLVNLYEQGINGILADEMGLGKTVQSISVMGYLAEKYDIWGPFLVIAPASTLHNWQQEITRFVPDLKCLPYWGNAKDRKILRKFWDRKHITYNKESPFHVLITSYQLVVQDSQYFQKVKWQYMILDEAQAIKSSQSTRWKSLLSFHCRNRLLLTGTPIQNNMQELWALLHFIMPSLFDSHDEFSEWFSKDIESHAQSNTKLNEDQLKRLHMILKPFMLRRVKKHVQKELGDKKEEDVYCDLTYRQRAFYGSLRNRISIMDLIEKAAVGDDQDTATLMNLVMQFRKVCNHPDLFERADTTSPLAFVHFAETASFLREGQFVNVDYSTRNAMEYDLPRTLCSDQGRLDMAGPKNDKAGFRRQYLDHLMNIWTPENIRQNASSDNTFSWLRFADVSPGEAYKASCQGLAERAIDRANTTITSERLARFRIAYDQQEDEPPFYPNHALFNLAHDTHRRALAEITSEGHMAALMNASRSSFMSQGLGLIEQCARPGVSAPPIQITCSDQASQIDKENTIFDVPLRKALYGASSMDEMALIEAKIRPSTFPPRNMLSAPISQRTKYTNIQVPSMRRFVTDSGKLARLDLLLRELKEGGHRVLLYFQMTRMIDLMEEYLTFRNYKYLRLDGSTKLEDRRDTVADFQTKPEIFVFLLSTRAGGLGINLTAADTVIFYDSDWNPTIDSQAMDRAHRLGQTRQVTVYRMITRGTIEERIRKRALQKEEVQRVVISGGSGAGVDFSGRGTQSRTKDIALWLADDEQAELIEKKEQEVAAKSEERRLAGGNKKKASSSKKKEVSLDDMYHEGEGHFEGESGKPSGTATPNEGIERPSSGAPKKSAARSKKSKLAH